MVTRALAAAPEHVVDIADDALPLLDDAMVACIDRLVAWAAQHAGEYGVELQHARVRRWQSIEDPDWVQVVVDLTVHGGADEALRYWEGASEALDEFARPLSPDAVDLLDVFVHWR